MPVPVWLAVLTVVFSLLAKLAICFQIRKNGQRQTCDGLSLPFFIIGMLSYDSWLLEGILGHSWSLILGQGPGALLFLVVAWQYARFDVASRFGKRMNAWGHFTRRRSCESCQDVGRELGGCEHAAWPVPCPECGPGLVHVSIEIDRFRQSDDWPVSMILRCDSCTLVRQETWVSREHIRCQVLRPQHATTRMTV